MHLLAERFAWFTVALSHNDEQKTSEYLNLIREHRTKIKNGKIVTQADSSQEALAATGDLEMWLGNRLSYLKKHGLDRANKV